MSITPLPKSLPSAQPITNTGEYSPQGSGRLIEAIVSRKRSTMTQHSENATPWPWVPDPDL